MIRDKFYKDITTTIDNHLRFDNSDFKISSTKDNYRGINLTIRYNLEPKYKIIFNIPTTTEKDGSKSVYSFSGNVCPGPLALEETFTFNGENGVYEKITTWLNCIWEELSANPIIKQVERQQQQIDEIFGQFDDLKDEFFSTSEADDLKVRLDKLEETLKGEIEKNGEDRKLYQEKISALHTDIDTLKQTINSFNKKGWLKSFTSKVFKWTKNSENRKLVSDGYKVIKEFLPEHIKIGLPE